MILSKLNKTEKKSLIVTDARKNKVYTALYDKQNTLIKPKLEDKENIIKYIDNNTYIISDKTINKYLNELNIESTIYEENDENFGLYLSEITYNKIKENKEDFNWAKVKPLYIQQPSITKPKEIKNV